MVRVVNDPARFLEDQILEKKTFLWIHNYTMTGMVSSLTELHLGLLSPEPRPGGSVLSVWWL